MTSAMWELVEVKVAEYIKEHGIDETTKDEILKRFGEVGLECMITNYKV